MNETIPQGYRRNALGHLVPEDRIKPVDKERDDFVNEMFARAEALQKRMRTEKNKGMADIYAFIELMGERYDVKIGGDLGNITLTNFDGTKQVRINQGSRMTFGEELLAARELVNECIRGWADKLETDGANPDAQDALGHIRALVEHAFRTDQQGKLSPSKIWELTQVEITNDDAWVRAMEAIRDAVRWEGQKPYLRFNFRRPEDGKWEALSLNMAEL